MSSPNQPISLKYVSGAYVRKSQARTVQVFTRSRPRRGSGAPYSPWLFGTRTVALTVVEFPARSVTT